MKKKLIAITIFLIICIASTFIYAAIDAKIQINPSSSTVKPGEEVTFTVKVKDIVSENGANGLEGTISYDTDVFEPIQDGNVTKAGSWDVAYYNQKVIAEGLSAIKSDSDVINIKLKVKDDNSLVGRTSSLSLNNAVVYNTEKVELGSVSGSVKIVAKEDGGNQEQPQETQKPQETDKPDKPQETQKPNQGNDATPTPSTKPGGTNTTPAPEGNANQNNGSNKEDIPITNIDTNTSTGSSSNKGNSTTVGSSSTGSSKTNTTNSTTAITSIPKAGINSALVVLTIVVAALGTVAYIKLRKYNEI